MKAWRRDGVALWASLLGAVALAVAFNQGLQWYRQARFNAALAADDYGRFAAATTPAERFAAAYALHRDDPPDAERLKAILTLYTPLFDHPRWGSQARFNAATLQLQMALALTEAERDLALPLAELAKSGLRELLRRDAGHWQAKVNLELALRRFPDPPLRASADSPPPAHNPRSVTAREAKARGLP